MAKAVNKAEKEIIEGETEKQKKLRVVLEQLNKEYGQGTIIGSNNKAMSIDAISTGSIALDAAIGIGGLPRGRIIEITAPESAGKSTLALHIVANAQSMGLTCVYIDMEHAMDYSYAKALKVNVEDLIISQPDYGELALEIAEKYIKTGEVGVVVIDSTAALTPKAEVESGVGDPKMAGIGRIMSQALRVLVGPVHNTNCMLIFINQIRDNVGGMVAEKPTGGNSLKFYASVRLDLRRVKNDKAEELSRTKIKVLKNKVGTPFKEIEVDLVWGKGFGKMGEIVDIAEELEIIKRSGSWYSHGDSKIGQGRNAVIELLEANSEFATQLEMDILEKLKQK